jgi:hypothetical protein
MCINTKGEKHHFCYEHIKKGVQLQFCAALKVENFPLQQTLQLPPSG